MKINIILIKISHFFGLRIYEEQQDDITINIPTAYQEKGLDEIWDMKDIMNQIYDRFKQDTIIEKRCRNVKQVWVTYYSNPDNTGGGSIVTRIPYVDGVLYNPFEKGVYESLERNRKIEQLLND